MANMKADVITPDDVAVDIHHAVADLSGSEFVGKLVEFLVNDGVISPVELQAMLPMRYRVREF